MMKKAFIFLGLLLVYFPPYLFAEEIPTQINYQGYVTSGGSAFTGAGSFKFSLIDDETTPTQNYWTNDGSIVSAGEAPTSGISATVSSGVFNVSLGDTSVTNMTAINAGVFRDISTVYLRVWFDDGTHGYEKLSPDKRVTSSAFAYKAALVNSTSQKAVVLSPFHTDSGDTGEIRFVELPAGGTDHVGFKAPDSITAHVIWTLPSADGSANQVLSTSGAKVLSWKSVGSDLGAILKNGTVTFTGDQSHGDKDITNVDDISLNTISSDGTTIGIGTTAGVDTSIGNSTGNFAVTGDNIAFTCIDETDNVFQIVSSTGPVLLDIDLGASNILTLGIGWTASGQTCANLGTVTTADIDSGTIDGTIIGGSSAVVGTFTTANATTFDTNVAAAAVTLSGTTLSADGTDVDINIAVTPKGTGEVDITKVDIASGEIDGTTIGGNGAAVGTFTTANATTFDTNVAAAAVTLSGTTLSADGTDVDINIAVTPKGTGEVDITKVDIASGEIDGTTVGANVASTGKFTQLTSTLSATDKVYIDATTTAHTGTDGALDIDLTTSETMVPAVNITSINNATTGKSTSSIYNSLTSTAVVTGTAQNLYGINNVVTKTGADTSVATTTLYGVYGSASDTGHTNVANTRNTYGGYFSATGSNPGITSTSTAYGIYATATGADTNYGLYVASGSSRFDSRVLQAQGSDVPSGNDITLGNGNYFDITGGTQINRISGSGWTAGSVVILQFDGAPAVKHGLVAGDGYYGLQLQGAGDFPATSGDTLTLVFDGAWWRQVSRAQI